MRSNKYGAELTELDGIVFHSKKESRYYAGLKYAKMAGDLRYFLRQVPIHLPGGIKYVVDFVEFWTNGDVRYIDVKGFRTPTYCLKKKQVEALYPIQIIEA